RDLSRAEVQAGSVQRLDLRLGVNREDDRPLGRTEIEADDVMQLLDELRIPGELERSHPVRPKAMCLPAPSHGSDPPLSQCTCAPRGALFRRWPRCVRRTTSAILDRLI